MSSYNLFLKNYKSKNYFNFLEKDIIKNKEEDFFFEMCLIRTFEKKLLELFEKNLINGTTHTYIGQEVNSTCIFKHLNLHKDIIWSNHRCHGHFISYCFLIVELMAEILGKTEGVCKGRGGSQHLHYKNFYSNGLLGGSLPQAVGAAFAIKNSKDISVIFIGDGTLGSGYLYESMNLSSIWNCPILFICENNFIAQTTPSSLTVSGKIDLRANSFGIKTFSTYDYDLKKINTISKKAIEYVRNKRLPAFLEIGSIRLGPHSKGDDTRSKKEILILENKDPYLKIKKKIKNSKKIEELCFKVIEQTFTIVNKFATAK